MTQDQRINNGLQALRYEVAELRRETSESGENRRRELEVFKLETSQRLTTIEVGVGVMRWLFAAFLAILSIFITVASVVIGYIQGG